MLLEYIIKKMTRKKVGNVKFSRNMPEIPNGKDEIGLYIHIPFCKVPCPFCAYIRYPWNPKLERPYVGAVKKEIDLYLERLGDVRINSIYVGGGTPTIMPRGVADILKHTEETFDVSSDIGVESNPDDLNEKTLELLLDAGVSKLSMGVQSFSDEILKAIGRRSHDAKQSLHAIELVMDNGGFDTFSIDLMFSLPTQTLAGLKKDLEITIEKGVPQVATYPLLLFPYCKMYRDEKEGKLRLPGEKAEKQMYDTIVDSFTEADYEPCSVWSFVKKGRDKYGSVERDEYIGIGAGAISSVNQYFYANTASIEEYIRTVGQGDLPITIGAEFQPEGVAAKWLSISLYEMEFDKREFKKRFGMDVDEKFKSFLRWLKLFGIIKVEGDHVRVTRKGMYPIHLMTKTFLLTFIAKACIACMENPKPIVTKEPSRASAILNRY
ncbi:MAG: coproporphyrinogen-III oxidase family protein [Candidatus Hodarchaeaceae archaeon]|nr:coproporphyrinogen-III oxidase family protein [Candidatus Hodarchaeaceae archaeon]